MKCQAKKILTKFGTKQEQFVERTQTRFAKIPTETRFAEISLAAGDPKAGKSTTSNLKVRVGQIICETCKPCRPKKIANSEIPRGSGPGTNRNSPEFAAGLIFCLSDDLSFQMEYR